MQVFRFAIVGGASTMVHLAIGITLINSGWDPVVANAIAFCFAFLVSFSGHFGFTFSPAQETLLPSFKRFVILAVWGFALNELVLSLLLIWTALPAVGALIISTLLVACTTYLLCRNWVFVPA